MNHLNTSRRLAATGAAAALAAGALVTATATTAHAGTGETTYTCNLSVLGPVSIPVTTTVPDLGPLPAGGAIPADQFVADFVIGASPAVAQVLGGVTAVSSDNFALPLGGSAVPMEDLAIVGGAPDPDGALGSMLFDATASSGAFTAPAPGDHDLTMPSAFNLTGMAGTTPFSVPCTTDAPAALGKVSVVRNESTTDARAVRSRVQKGTRAKVVTKVLSAGRTPTGDVVAKLGRKTIGRGVLEDGRAVVRLARLSVGRHKVVMKYLGDTYTTASKDPVVIRVVR